MEVKRSNINANRWLRWIFFTTLLVLGNVVQVSAQDAVCKVKDGKLYIEVQKSIGEAALENFIEKYELADLRLKDCLAGKYLDTLQQMGWQIEINTTKTLAISKRLSSDAVTNNPADKIIFADKNRSFAERFPVVSRSVVYGVNRFRNKFPFHTQDSIVTFFLRNNQNARRVMLAGSFNDWKPDALAMKKTDSGWIALVKLAPGKYWYKFIVDGGWRIDSDNLINENDGQGNTNSVYFKSNTRFKLRGFTNAKRIFVSGSFNEWRERELLLIKENDQWVLPVYLYQGTHTYRFIVDGKWITDPDNQDKFPNEFNDFNSVIRIGTPYVFKLNSFSNDKEVVLTGSFNKWRDYELFMRKVPGGWELPYTLGPGNYEYRFLVNGKKVTDPFDKSILNIPGHSGNSFFIISPNYTFRLNGFPDAKAVFLAGDFNDWSPNTFHMTRVNNGWQLKVHLLPGKHSYKFIVDGKWMIDPANRQWEQGNKGSNNSVLWFE